MPARGVLKRGQAAVEMVVIALVVERHHRAAVRVVGGRRVAPGGLLACFHVLTLPSKQHLTSLQGGD